MVPCPYVGAAIMVAFDEYTEANGATRIIPGSHTIGWNGDPESESDNEDELPSLRDIIYGTSNLKRHAAK